MDLISIITPVYNSRKYIEETVQSVLNQTYTNWEMVIVDDCSTDGSVAIINKFVAMDNRIRLIEQPVNMGHPSYARNIALKEAKGKYIAFLDSDDVWYPNKLELQTNYIKHNPDCYILCSSYEKINEHGESRNRIVLSKRKVNYKELLKSNSIGNLTGMYNQDRLGKCFQEPIIHEDYIMWLALVKVAGSAHGIPEVTAKYRIHDNSVSSSKTKVLRAQWYIYRRILHLNVVTSIFYFTCYAYFGLKKYLI
jgi:teichuronic acid biosynthesis glycosyltransferase TuaG